MSQSESPSDMSPHLRGVRRFLEQRARQRALEQAEAFEEPAPKRLDAPSGWTAELVAEFLAFYDEQDALLVARGFHATSRWWRDEIERFLLSRRKRWVIRVG